MSDRSNYTMSNFDKDYSPKIEQAICKQLSGQNNSEAMLKAIEGGKRLRSKLAFIVFKACGGKDDAKGYKVAVSAELTHSTSLIKDDIIDKDKERRGKESLWVEKGPLETMRTADSMLISGIEGIVDLGANVIKTLLGGWKTAWKGETRDLSILKGLEKINGPFYTAYITTIEQKTASLFSTFTKMAAEAANADSELIELMEKYGKDVGIAYQLSDDMVDLKKGKIEFLPIVVMAQLDQSIKEQITDAVNKGKMNIGEMLLGAGVNLEGFYRSEIRERLNRLKSVAGSEIIPNTKFKALLTEFPKYCISSMLKEGGIEGLA